jgi:hypothetical protein
MSAQAVVERFFTAFYAGDAGAARETITEDFTLAGSPSPAGACPAAGSSTTRPRSTPSSPPPDRRLVEGFPVKEEKHV